MARCGVYQIRCRSTGHRYVGSAEDIDLRWASHKRDLKRSKHANKALQYAWSLFGEDDFEFSVLEEISADQLSTKETQYLLTLKPEFNVLATAGERSPGRVAKTLISVRLPPSTLVEIKRYCAAAKMSQTDLLELSILEYLKNHGLDTHYILTPCPDHFVLLRVEGEQATVVEVVKRNGVPLKTVHEQLVAKLGGRPITVEWEKEPKTT